MALTTGLVVALLMVVGVLQHRQLGADHLQALQNRQGALAEAVAGELARHLDLRLAAVGKAAQRIALITDTGSRRRVMRESAAASPGLDSIALLSLSGDVLEGQLPRASFALLDHGLDPILAAGRPAFLGPLALRAGGPPSILLLAPVRSSAGTTDSVVAALASAVPAEILARTASATSAEIGHVEITTGGAAPTYLVHPDRSRVFAAVMPDTDSVVARRPIGQTDWSLGIVLPAQALVGPVAGARSRLWTQLAVLSIVLSALGSWSMHRLLRPIASLGDSVQAARRSGAVAIPADNGLADVRGELARAFDALCRDLQASRAELDALNAASPVALQRQAATLRSITEAIPAIVVVVDAEGRYRFVNSAFERWYGTPRDRIVGCTLPQVLGPLEYEKTRQHSDRALAGESVDFERRYQHADGVQNLAISYIPLRLDNGEADGFVGVYQDITHHRREEGRLLQLAQRDGLTGLLNRIGFEEHLESCLDIGEGPGLALLYIDLDHFKPVNDEFGHPVGDRVLQTFAARLRDAVRPTDASARLGGDEFAVVLKGVRDLEHANRVAGKIVDAARTPFEIDGRVLHIGASVGVAYGLKAGSGWRDLVSHADTLLYEAKKAGRGRHASAMH